jgi:uncharacterized DUF497 family protein
MRYGEFRTISTGPIGDRLYTMVWTEAADDRVRVISLRLSTPAERKAHAKEFRGG